MEILRTLKYLKFINLEIMVSKRNLTYNGKKYFLDKKYFDAENKSSWGPPGIYEKKFITLQSLFSPEDIKLNSVAIDNKMYYDYRCY